MTAVDLAFANLNKHIINLEKDRTDKARASRDWLIGQLTSLPDKEDNLPTLYEGKSVKFGSFARDTKIRELDDIDIILTFAAHGSTYLTHTYGQNYTLSGNTNVASLKSLCNDDGTLNSIKVVNKLVKALSNIEHYKSAAIHRRQEAATLDLSSYEWTFDIVPSFYTDTDYYLIPDGNGGWKATDPRVDQKRIDDVVNIHGKKALQLIRTVKYWNKKSPMTTIPTYLLENFVINYLLGRDPITEFIDVNLIYFWSNFKSEVYNTVNDPKGFQGDLNKLSFAERNAIATKTNEHLLIGVAARQLETDGEYEKSKNKWQEIFKELSV